METVNWQQLTQDAAKAAEPPALGDHVARIVKVNYKPTKKDGDPMVEASWRIVAGPDEGKVVRDRFVFSVSNPTALHMQFGKLRVLGIAPESLPQPGPALAAIFQDKVATITVKSDREWQGVPQYEVDSYAAAPAGFGGATAPPPIAQPPAAAPVAAAPAPTTAPPPPPAEPVQAPPAPVEAAAPPPPPPPAPAPVAAPVVEQPTAVQPPPPPVKPF